MHPHIEKYLEQLKRQLKSLPPDQSAEEIREIGIHLQALVEEGREGGLCEDEAVRAAIAQFGSHRKVGRELCRVALDGAPNRLPRTLTMLTSVILGNTAMNFIFFAIVMTQMDAWRSLGDIYGTGAYYRNGAGMLKSLLYIQVVMSLRQLRYWAYWMALLLFTHSTIEGFFRFFTLLSIYQQSPGSQAYIVPGSYGHPVSLYVLGALASVCLNFFCLLALVLNCKSFFRATRVRWST